VYPGAPLRIGTGFPDEPEEPSFKGVFGVGWESDSVRRSTKKGNERRSNIQRS
jgi:hypothetical protein